MSAPVAVPSSDADVAATQRIRAILSRYAEPLFREVAHKLLKPRNRWASDELLERILHLLSNPPMLDRRLRELPDTPRRVLALMALTRQACWRVATLVELLATLGHHEGVQPILQLLEMGLCYPLELEAPGPEVDDLVSLLGQEGILTAQVWVHPRVLARAGGVAWDLPALVAAEAAPTTHPRSADGLDWPLRMAVVWQQVLAMPLRRTQTDTLFKKDWQRLQADELLNAPFVEELVPLPDKGLLTFALARQIGLLQPLEAELHAGAIPASWEQGLVPSLIELFASLPNLDDWDPLRGSQAEPYQPALLPVLGITSLLLLSQLPAEHWTTVPLLTDWLRQQHPSWTSILPELAQAEAWLQAFFLGVAFPLRLVEVVPETSPPLIRLSDLGEHLLRGQPEPALQQPFPQTLLVQPNAELIVYRQGLTPGLIGKLAHVAAWKSLSTACTMELTAEQVYLGLERGMNLAAILQVLQQHGMRPVPEPVADLLEGWATKRERITVYSAATLLEFATPEDLDEAVGRGLIEVRVTDRIGLVADESQIDYRQLRQVGNRDYEGRPQQCLSFEADGVTFNVDATRSDLLLETELRRMAEPLESSPTQRRYRLTPESLHQARSLGVSLTDLETWVQDRAGEALSPAARLIYPRDTVTECNAEPKLVVFLPSEEVTDGILQWPRTRAWIESRLGPTTISLAENHLDELRLVLETLGMVITWASGAELSSRDMDAPE